MSATRGTRHGLLTRAGFKWRTRYTGRQSVTEEWLMSAESETPSPSVGLFATCAVDLLRPSVGFAAVRLLEDAGCRVCVPEQSCCGQVAYNSGLREDTARLARQVIRNFADVDYVVVPSGSCASMLRNHYPALFDAPSERGVAETFAGRVYELTTFLDEVMDYRPRPAAAESDLGIAYHDSCAGLRELGIRRQPRRLLERYSNCHPLDPDNREECCGFGGTFCMKFPEIADRMAADKAAAVIDTDADLLLGGDLTCLVHIAGKLHRQGHQAPRVRHVAEFLAGETGPAIGEEE